MLSTTFGFCSNSFDHLIEVIYVRIYGLKRERGWGGGVLNCLREVFEKFSMFNKILCVNPEQESS